MEKKYQAFIGSTYNDLVEERQIVLNSLLQNSFIPAGMESFPASSKQQFEFIKPIIDASDIYILVIAGRYGTLSPTGKSYTEEEYNYALRQGKIILPFIHNNTGNISYAKSETDPEKLDLLQQFRNRILESQLCNMWDNPYELSLKVVASLHQATTDPGILGWVRGNSELSYEGQMLLTQARIKVAELTGEVQKATDTAKRLESAVIAQFNDAMKAATPAEYDAWEAGAIEQGQPQKLINHTAHLGEIKIAHKDFVLPTMHGTRAVTIIIPPNVTVYKTDIGHSTLLYMKEFRVEGNIAELFSDRRVN